MTAISNEHKKDRYEDIVANYNPNADRGYAFFAKKYGVSTQRIKQIVLKAKERGEIQA